MSSFIFSCIDNTREKIQVTVRIKYNYRLVSTVLFFLARTYALDNKSQRVRKKKTRERDIRTYIRKIRQIKGKHKPV